MKKILQETFEKHIKLVQNHFNLNENNLKNLINENTPQQNLRQLVQNNELSEKDKIQINNMDPHKNKAYSYWIAKQYLNNNVTLDDDLKNTVNSFHELVTKNKITGKESNIDNYTDLDELKNKVEYVGSDVSKISKSELKSDFEVIADNEDVYIVVPHTHEASRKLGLSNFAYRITNPNTGEKDCAWCTTFDNPKNWNNYYHKQGKTLYYIEVKSQKLYDELKKARFDDERLKHVSVAVSENKSGLDETYYMKAYDSQDNPFEGQELNNYLEIIVKYV